MTGWASCLRCAEVREFESFEVWRSALYQAGNLDFLAGDGPIDDERLDRHVTRYQELVKQTYRRETVEMAKALIGSMQSKDDDGLYDEAIGALALFPEEIMGRGVAMAWDELTTIHPKYAGEVVSGVCNAGYDAIKSFNEVYAELEPAAQGRLTALIEYHESDVWLADAEKGLLTPVHDTFLDSL
jgi:hypothetical protein